LLYWNAISCCFENVMISGIIGDDKGDLNW
jgi:hypothetical protein